MSLPEQIQIDRLSLSAIPTYGSGGKAKAKSYGRIRARNTWSKLNTRKYFLVWYKLYMNVFLPNKW